MKYLQLLSIFIIVTSCGQTGDKQQTIQQDTSIAIPQPADEQPEKVSDDNYLIIPGERVGQTTIGITTDSMIRLLKRPDESDAAMGKAWHTWHGRQDEHNNRTRLDVYTAYADSNMQSQIVKQIHTTSSSFQTSDGVHVHSSMQGVRRSFPNLKLAKRYSAGGRIISIYDDEQKGIAFEQVTANGQDICIGIVVHQRTVPVNESYIYLQPGAEVVEP